MRKTRKLKGGLIGTFIKRKLLNNNSDKSLSKLLRALKENNLAKVKEIIAENPKLTKEHKSEISGQIHSLEIAQILIENGYVPDADDLYAALYKHNRNDFYKLYINHGADINGLLIKSYTSYTHPTLLQSLCCYEDIETYKFLFKWGADVNALDNEGDNMMKYFFHNFYAGDATKEMYEALKLFIKHGLKLNGIKSSQYEFNNNNEYELEPYRVKIINLFRKYIPKSRSKTQKRS